MTLEKHHVAAYFPYGLEGYVMGETVEGTEYDENPIPKLFTVHAIFQDNQLSVICDGIKEIVELSDFFPHLRPLSELTKDEKFIQMIDEELICGAWKFVQDDWTTSIKTSDNRHTLLILQGEVAPDCDLFYYQFMIENKYDVYGLIPAKLAYDINTVNLQDGTRN